MNKKTENLNKELEELIPLYVKLMYLNQIVAQKENDIVERYTTLGFTREELEIESKKVYDKLTERQVVPSLEVPQEKLIAEV